MNRCPPTATNGWVDCGEASRASSARWNVLCLNRERAKNLTGTLNVSARTISTYLEVLKRLQNVASEARSPQGQATDPVDDGSLNARKRRHRIASQGPGAISLPHLRFFFAKMPSPERLPPFWGRNRFWTGFWERGHEQFSESNSPPYRGGRICRAHIQARLRCAEPGSGANLIAPKVPEPVG